jgi:hypothetical protein
VYSELVHYFEDGAYGWCAPTDLVDFDTSKRPFTDYVKVSGSKFLMHPGVRSALEYVSTGKLGTKMMEGMLESKSTEKEASSKSSVITYKEENADKEANAAVSYVGLVVLIQPEDRDAEGVFATVLEQEIRPSNLFAGGPSSKRRKMEELFFRVKYFVSPKVCEGPLVVLRDRRLGKKRRNPSSSAAGDMETDSWVPARWMRMRLPTKGRGETGGAAT